MWPVPYHKLQSIGKMKTDELQKIPSRIIADMVYCPV